MPYTVPNWMSNVFIRLSCSGSASSSISTKTCSTLQYDITMSTLSLDSTLHYVVTMTTPSLDRMLQYHVTMATPSLDSMLQCDVTMATPSLAYKIFSSAVPYRTPILYVVALTEQNVVSQCMNGHRILLRIYNLKAKSGHPQLFKSLQKPCFRELAHAVLSAWNYHSLNEHTV